MEDNCKESGEKWNWLNDSILRETRGVCISLRERVESSWNAPPAFRSGCRFSEMRDFTRALTAGTKKTPFTDFWL